jgi:hypothetical protein
MALKPKPVLTLRRKFLLRHEGVRLSFVNVIGMNSKEVWKILFNNDLVGIASYY